MWTGCLNAGLDQDQVYWDGLEFSILIYKILVLQTSSASSRRMRYASALCCRQLKTFLTVKC